MIDELAKGASFVMAVATIFTNGYRIQDNVFGLSLSVESGMDDTASSLKVLPNTLS
jgi:hypothetical protein